MRGGLDSQDDVSVGLETGVATIVTLTGAVIGVVAGLLA
jgi:hypothetical protein